MHSRLRKLGLSIAIVLASGASLAMPTLEEALTSTLPQACHVAGDFREAKELTGLDIALNSTGRFIFSCEQGLVWLSQTPVKQALLYGHHGQHVELKANQSFVTPISGTLHTHLSRLLLAIMGSDFDYLAKYFSVSHADTDQSITTLTPKQEAMTRFINALIITKTDEGAIIEFNQPNVGRTTLTINNTKILDAITLPQCMSTLNHGYLCQQFLKFDQPLPSYTDFD